MGIFTDVPWGHILSHLNYEEQSTMLCSRGSERVTFKLEIFQIYYVCPKIKKYPGNIWNVNRKKLYGLGIWGGGGEGKVTDVKSLNMAKMIQFCH